MNANVVDMITEVLEKSLKKEKINLEEYKEKLTEKEFPEFLKGLKYCIAKINMKETEPMMGKCYECKFRGNIPGDCHSTCTCKTAIAFGDKEAIRRGYFAWPLNFDPVWLKYCDSFEKK